VTTLESSSQEVVNSVTEIVQEDVNIS